MIRGTGRLRTNWQGNCPYGVRLSGGTVTAIACPNLLEKGMDRKLESPARHCATQLRHQSLLVCAPGALSEGILRSFSDLWVWLRGFVADLQGHSEMVGPSQGIGTTSLPRLSVLPVRFSEQASHRNYPWSPSGGWLRSDRDSGLRRGNTGIAVGRVLRRP